MPNLADMTLERAKSTIGTYNLSEGKVDEDYDDTIPAGRVSASIPLQAPRWPRGIR